MSQSILESLMSSVTPQLLGSIASKLGESNSAVGSGLKTAAAVILSALAGKASDSGFLNQLVAMFTNPALGSNLLSNVGSLASGGSSPLGDMASKLLGSLFGSNLGSVAGAVSKSAGVSQGSASTLLSMAAPLLLSTLGQHVKGSGLGVGSLGSLLSSEAAAASSFVPSGIASLLGGATGPVMAAAGGHGAGHGHGHHDEGPKEGNWLWPALALALLLGGILWFLNRGPENPHTAVTTPEVPKAVETATTAVTDAAKNAWAALGEFFKRKLPNGIELNIPRLGIENKLIDFIEDKTKVVDKTTWFDFDRLLFDTGKATLQPASQQQLEDIANVLKAYPNVEVKIGGYTDNTGDKAANLKLSQDRATNVMNELVKLGVAANRMAAEGYGDQFPVGDNATEEGRAKNRRISLRVTKK